MQTPPQGSAPQGNNYIQMPQTNSLPDVKTVASIKATLSRKAEELVKAGQPYVMTGLGPIPLPDDVRHQIPEKFVAAPVLEEREVIVAKREVQERIIEVPQIQYEHKFVEIPKQVVVEKIIPVPREVIREVEIPRYTATVQEKLIEVPQGIKFVEVPVEVPIAYPPKIVPVPKQQVVERIVELSRPVVEERVLEIPQHVYKQVPVYKDVEVPYVLPRYVEKIVEVPFHPGMLNEDQQPPQFVPPQLMYPPNAPPPPMPPVSAPVMMQPQLNFAGGFDTTDDSGSDCMPSNNIPPVHMLPQIPVGLVPQMIPLQQYAAYPIPHNLRPPPMSGNMPRFVPGGMMTMPYPPPQ